MPYFSDNENLEIGENYTRGMLADYLNTRYVKEKIERRTYVTPHYSSIIFFSTIDNTYRSVEGRLSDTIFVFSRGNYIIGDNESMHKEILLFVRMDDSTGFYYFGRCNYYEEYENLENYADSFYFLELMDTRFSKNKGIEIPDLSH